MYNFKKKKKKKRKEIDDEGVDNKSRDAYNK